MRTDDTRRLDKNTQEFIRKRAVSLVLEGEPVPRIAKDFNVNRTTVYEWISHFQEGGLEALATHPIPGCPSKLTKEQQKQIVEMIVGHDPREYGMETALWTRKIISDLIMRTVGISLGVSAVGAMLHSWDIVPQKPLRRAYERDSEEIEKWTGETYPAIRERAAKRDADIVFLDEMGIRSDSPLGRTWGEKGERTTVATSSKRQSINAISAVSYQGAFWFDLYSGSLNAETFEQEVAKLMRYRHRPLFIILDSLPAHRARRVEEYVKSLNGKLELHFLPGYAPDINPDEYVWNYVKSHGPSKVPLTQGESLTVRIGAVLNEVKNQPGMLQNIVQPIVNSFELSGSFSTL